MSNKGVSMSNEMNLPWEVCHNSWEVSTIYDCNEYPVCSIRIDPDVTEHTQDILERAKEERAAHIVKCVNAHESLVAAAQAVVDVTDQEGYCGPETIGYAIEALRAALAKAQGDGK